MKVYDKIVQGSDAWEALRIGICTASELKHLVTAKYNADGVAEFTARQWSTEMPNTYLAAKLAEKWRGQADEGFTSYAMEQGSIREHQAIPWYEGIYDVKIHRVGFVTTDDGRFGFSPDGMFEDEPGLKNAFRIVDGMECKVPEPKTHVKYLLAGVVPEEYLPQVHGSIYGADAAYWKFMSWRPEFPKLVVHVERDRRILDGIEEVLTDFSRRFDSGWARMVEMNGGEPEKTTDLIESHYQENS